MKKTSMVDQEWLLKGAVRIVEAAKRQGADGVWVSAEYSHNFETVMSNGKFKKPMEKLSCKFTMHLYVANRFSTYSTNDLNLKQLKSFVSKAIAQTRALAPDLHRQLPNPGLFEIKFDQDLQLWDPAVKKIDPNIRQAWCQEINDLCRGKDQVIKVEAHTYDSEHIFAAVSSNGFYNSWKSTSVGLLSFITMQDFDDSQLVDGLGMSSRHIENLMTPFDISKESLRRARARLGTKNGPMVVAPMVVDRGCSTRLIQLLLRPAHARAIEQDQSFWKNKIGLPILSKKLTIVDDPLIVAGIRSRPFDAEGIASRRISLIEKGALHNYYTDTYFGSKLGIAPTTGSISNQVCASGEGDLYKHLNDVQSGVYVTNFLGGDSDATTGDFSISIYGHLIEDGKIGKPVNNMNIIGNILQLFAQLQAVGDDPLSHSWCQIPTLVFDGVQFFGQ